MPTPPDSAALMIQMLGYDRSRPLSPAQEDLAIIALINQRACDWCGVEAGQACRVFGGFPHPRRTHPVRLKTTSVERQRIIRSVNRTLRQQNELRNR